MKTVNYNFQWYEKEDARKVLCVSVGKDGKMYLGQGMRELLPSYIKVGFDEKNRVLAIARGCETDIVLPKAGVFNMRTLAEHIAAIGLELPVFFKCLQIRRMYLLERSFHAERNITATACGSGIAILSSF